MKKKIILTKKSLQTLHNALSVDDILYEFFRRKQAELYRESERLIKNKMTLWAVTKINQSGMEVFVK